MSIGGSPRLIRLLRCRGIWIIG
ncbi:hypothetical protein RSAG8_00570, partial [Rhizoctonia solani AG-8 WAC10335]